MNQFDVYGIGQCAWDCIGQIDAFPKADTKCELPQIVMQGGGPVATALVALSRWGLTCSFCGVVGDDYFGQQILSSLHEEKIITEDTLVRKGTDSQYAFIAAETGSGKRTIFWRRPTGLPVQPEELNGESIRRSHLLHTDGLFTDASISAAKIAREAGIPVVVDAGTFREGMLELAGFSDYFIVSQVFAEKLVGKNQPHNACRELRKLGPKVVGVTLGKNGYLALSGTTWIEKPTYPVKAIDTTGCGDLFHAGISFGVLKKWPIEQTLDFAAWAAAQVSRYLGGRNGIPSISDYTST